MVIKKLKKDIEKSRKINFLTVKIGPIVPRYWRMLFLTPIGNSTLDDKESFIKLGQQIDHKIPFQGTDFRIFIFDFF